MGLESATYINDLQPTNPTSTDAVSQGDDHLRLIKQVLQNTFVGASRQWQIPGAVAVSATGSITKANGESVIFVSTASGAVTLTLPTLVALDAGWKTVFIKTSSDANPIFIAPPSGTINSGGVAGLSKARRCIPGVQFIAFWDGANWFVTRVTSLPIGSCIEYHGTTLPAGYEWPNGQTLSSAANYPEYNSVTGGLTTRDKRGYTSICMDNLGGTAAGRLPSGIISGSTAWATGGTDSVTLTGAQIPAHQHNVYLHENSHTHNFNSAGSGITSAVYAGIGNSFVYSAGGAQGGQLYSTSIQGTTTGMTIGSVSGVANDNQTAANTGGGGLHSNLQPSIMVNQILVVE